MAVRFPPSGFTDKTAARAGVRYASWLRRAAGFIIDALIIATIRYVVVGVFALSVGPLTNHYLGWLLLLGIVSSISFLYATLCLAKLDGQTPGMRVMQIRCVPVSQRGRISMPQSITRALTFTVVVSVPLFFAEWVLVLVLVPLVAYLWPTVDQRRQTWWDHMAATVVLDDRGW